MRDNGPLAAEEGAKDVESDGNKCKDSPSPFQPRNLEEFACNEVPCDATACSGRCEAESQASMAGEPWWEEAHSLYFS